WSSRSCSVACPRMKRAPGSSSSPRRSCRNYTVTTLVAISASLTPTRRPRLRCRSRGEGREEALDRAFGGEGEGSVAVEAVVVMALEREHQRDAHDGARRDVGRLGLEAIAGFDFAPRFGQAVHGDGEVLAVEALPHSRIAEQHETEQGQHFLER